MKLTLHNPPEGYEAEAEYRQLKENDYFINVLSAEVARSGHNSPGQYRIVLTPKAELIPPPCITAGWIAMDQNGYWYWYSKKPVIASEHWNGKNYKYSQIFPKMISWAPPDNVNWKTSLVKCGADNE